MKRAFIIAALMATASPAFAQQAQPPELQAVLGKLQEEIGAELQWRAQAITLQAEVDKLKAEIAKLKGQTK